MPQPYIDEMGVTHYNDATGSGTIVDPYVPKVDIAGIDLSNLQIANDENNPVPVTAISLPLPTGAATSANQSTANTSLSNAEVLAVVIPQEAFNISETRTYDRILEAFNQRNTSNIISYLGVLKGGSVLLESSYTKLINLLQKTQLDPSYQPKVLMSDAELAGFSIVLVNEIEELL